MTKLLEHLKAVKAKQEAEREQTEIQKAKAALLSKVEAARAAGAPKNYKRDERILTEIFSMLEAYHPVEVKYFTLIPCKFFVAEEPHKDYDDKWAWRHNWCTPQLDYKLYADCSIMIHEEYDRSSWRSKPTGKLYMTIGGYGNKKRFKQLKAGGWRYREIAEELAHRMQGAIYKAKEAKRHKNNEALVEALRNTFELKQYYGAIQVSTTDVPGQVKIAVSKNFTLDETAASELIAALQGMGFKS